MQRAEGDARVEEGTGTSCQARPGSRLGARNS
jgi:hypothetical protein